MIHTMFSGKFVRLRLVFVAVLLTAVSLPGYGEDLMEAYRQAVNNDPTLAQAGAQQLAVGEGVPQARALLLPQVSAGLTLSQQNGANSIADEDLGDGLALPGNNFLCSGLTAGSGEYTCNSLGVVGDDGSASGGHSRSRDLSATLNQVIFDFSKIANLRAAHSTANAQDQLYDSALQDLYVRVASAYLSVLTDQDELKYAKASEESYRLSYEQASAQYHTGTIAITDMYTAKASYEASKAQSLTAEVSLNDAKQSLTQITGQPVGTLRSLRDDLPLDPPNPNDSNAWVQNALKYNPTLLADQQTVESAEHSISAARAGHLPTLNATVTRGRTTYWQQYGSSAGFPGNGSYGMTMGVTLTVPIFEGGAVQSKVRQSIDQRDSAQDSLEIDRRAAVRNTLNYFRSVTSGIGEVESGKASVESGLESLDGTKAGYTVGTKTMTDVLVAIQTLAQSESNYTQARHQFVLNNLLLKQAAGTISVKDLEAINALLQ